MRPNYNQMPYNWGQNIVINQTPMMTNNPYQPNAFNPSMPPYQYFIPQPQMNPQINNPQQAYVQVQPPQHFMETRKDPRINEKPQVNPISVNNINQHQPTNQFTNNYNQKLESKERQVAKEIKATTHKPQSPGHNIPRDHFELDSTRNKAYKALQTKISPENIVRENSNKIKEKKEEKIVENVYKIGIPKEKVSNKALEEYEDAYHFITPGELKKKDIIKENERIDIKIETGKSKPAEIILKDEQENKNNIKENIEKEVINKINENAFCETHILDPDHESLESSIILTNEEEEKHDKIEKNDAIITENVQNIEKRIDTFINIKASETSLKDDKSEKENEQKEELILNKEKKQEIIKQQEEVLEKNIENKIENASTDEINKDKNTDIKLEEKELTVKSENQEIEKSSKNESINLKVEDDKKGISENIQEERLDEDQKADNLVKLEPELNIKINEENFEEKSKPFFKEELKFPEPQNNSLSENVPFFTFSIDDPKVEKNDEESKIKVPSQNVIEKFKLSSDKTIPINLNQNQESSSKTEEIKNISIVKASLVSNENLNKKEEQLLLSNSSLLMKEKSIENIKPEEIVNAKSSSLKNLEENMDKKDMESTFAYPFQSQNEKFAHIPGFKPQLKILDVGLCNDAHSSILVYFCRSKKMAFCESCAKKYRSEGLGFVKIKDYISQYQSNLSKMLETSNKLIQNQAFGTSNSHSKEKKRNNIAQMFDDYIENIKASKDLILQIVDKEINEYENEKIKEIVEISEILTQKSIEVRKALITKRYIEILTFIDENFIDDQKKMLADMEERIIGVKDDLIPNIKNIVTLPNLGLEDSLKQLGINLINKELQLDTPNGSDDNAQDEICWSNGSKIFCHSDQDKLIIFSSNLPISTNCLIELKIRKMNENRLLSIGLSKIGLNIQSGFIGLGLAGNQICIFPNSIIGDRGFSQNLSKDFEYKEGDIILFKIKDGDVKILVNFVECPYLIKNFKVPLYLCGSSFYQNDEIEIVKIRKLNPEE